MYYFEANRVGKPTLITKSCFENLCPSEYAFNSYEYNLVSDLDNESKEWIVEIFPSEQPHVKYIYSQKMNFDQLIYQIGGIIGLWFGFSAFSLINFMVEALQTISCNIFLYVYRYLARKKVGLCKSEENIESTKLKKAKLKRRNTI